MCIPTAMAGCILKWYESQAVGHRPGDPTFCRSSSPHIVRDLHEEQEEKLEAA